MLEANISLLLSSSEIIERVLIILSLSFFGIFGRRLGFIKDEAKQSLANVVINITLPPLIFVSMLSDESYEQLSAVIFTPLISFILIIIGMVFISLLGRCLSIPKDRSGTFIILSTMPNSAFIGFPVILSLLGKKGLGYAVLYDLGSTVAFFSIAIMILKGNRIIGEWWRGLLNLPLFALILGLLVNRYVIEIPAVVIEPLQIMGNATIPLAMLLMGYMIGGVKFHRKFINLELIGVCIIKLLIYPIFAAIIISHLKLDTVLRAVIIIEAAMPSMASSTVLVQKYGGDEQFAATGTFITTILSVATIPLMVHFLL